jgi:uncharacterized protein (DUF934 family)
MPTLVKLGPDRAWAEPDSFLFVPDGEAIPAQGDIVVSLARLISEGDALLALGRRVGVRLQPSEAVEDLAYDLPRLALVELVFAKFRDGRPYSSARVLRGRLGYRGEVRAVGDVLRDQAMLMARCGFDAFVPADGSDADQWWAAVHRYGHVYQRAADDRPPIFAERDLLAAGFGHNRADEAGAQ